MNDRAQDPERHVPSPAFRASLETQLVDTYRREAQFVPPSLRMPPRRGVRWRTALAMAAGLVLGVGTQFAAAQVQDARQRDDIVGTLTVKRQVAEVKLEIAKSEYDLARKRFDVGTGTQISVLAAAAALRASEAEVQRISLDIVEAGMTSAAPRDDLWAPIVHGRDFIKERLRVDEQAASQLAQAATAAAQEAKRSVQVAALSQAAYDELDASAQDARAKLDMLAQKELLRSEFLDSHLAPETVARRLQMMEILADVDRTVRQLKLSQARAERIKKQLVSGMATELDSKRAEVETMELSLELQKLQAQMLAMRAAAKQ